MAATTAVKPEPTIIKPQEGPQTAFLQTPADISIYGGAAGGGKTYALLLEGCRHTANPAFGAVIFRRTSEEIRMQGGLWDESTGLYTLLNAKPREHELEWRFPSGANVRFEHLQHEKDKFIYQGAQICMLGFDELTHFTKSQFFYMLSRNRSICGIRPYCRATCNPDANSWVKEFLAPWLDKSHPLHVESGEILWMTRDGDDIVWSREPSDDAKSVTFIRATLQDNQILMAKDPGYLASLKAMSLVDRRRLLDGDWDIVEGGNMFHREWFEIVDCAPVELEKVRWWDMAATEAKPGKDPDWTVGVLLGKAPNKLVYVLDVQRIRATPLETETLVKQMAILDGTEVRVRMEQEGGSSGVTVIDHYTREVLMGWDFKGWPAKVNKAERAKPFSSYAEAGNVKIVKAHWNATYLNELSPFPNPEVHDDQVDASSGAFTELVPKLEAPEFTVW